MGRWKAIVPFVIALIIALLGGILTFRWATGQIAARNKSDLRAQTQPIAVATADLAWGTQLKAESLKLAPFLKESLPPGHFTDIASLQGRVLIAPVKQGQPVLESSLAPSSVATGGVSAIITQGKRALAVKGDKVIGLSGFIKPGNRVDVLVTLNDPRDKKEVTKVVLQDILVLAAGSEIKENEKGEPQPVDVYTLEVTPEEGEKLALSAAKGKLQFALRNPVDTGEVLTKGATVPETLESLRPAATAPPQKSVVSVSRRRQSVEVIRGTESSKEVFYE